MNKSLVLSALFLALPIGTALADGDVKAQPPAVTAPPAQPQAGVPATRLFVVRQRPSVSVYDWFNTSLPQGGTQ